MTRVPPSPASVRQLQRAVFPAHSLLAGIQLNVFSALAEGSKNVIDPAAQLFLDPEKLQVLMCVLATAGLSEVEDGFFANSPEASAYLVQGKPEFLDGEYKAFSDRWSRRAKTSVPVRTGKAEVKAD